MTGEWILTKKNICAALGLPAPAADEVYTKLNFAMDARPGCVALVSDITSDKTTAHCGRNCPSWRKRPCRRAQSSC